MNKIVVLLSVFVLAACASTRHLHTPSVKVDSRLSGSGFYIQAAAYGWHQRDSLALVQILAGNMPAFLKKLVPIRSTHTDATGKIYEATLFVMPDYLSIGSNSDWARIPLSPMAAQRIADSFNCFLPTRKIVDLIWQQATVKLEPVPMFAFRDSTVTMWQHHLIIEGQRSGRKGLIAGIKKDVVISEKICDSARPDRVAIYGWHRPTGKPIQPLYTGHVNWYVDYSHGVRLVSKIILVNGRRMSLEEVFGHPVLHHLICDEDSCTCTRYPYK